MEKLMMQHAKATDDDMRQFGEPARPSGARRACWLAAVSADRLFIVAAKPLSNEEQAKLKGKPNRVDFTMK